MVAVPAISSIFLLHLLLKDKVEKFGGEEEVTCCSREHCNDQKAPVQLGLTGPVRTVSSFVLRASRVSYRSNWSGK